MRKHTSKIYYSAGFISLILLPIFCVLNLKNNDAFKNCYSMDISIWNGKEDTLLKRTITLKDFLNSKKYSTINLFGDTSTDLKKLEKAENEIKNIISSKDSIRGVKFHFGDQSEYGTFIKVLDILAIQKAGFYVVNGNDIFFANPKVIKTKTNGVVIKSFICRSVQIQNKLQEDFINWELYKGLFEKYYLLVIVFFLMFFFQLKKIVK